jgi:hypothetical protein
MPLDQIMSHSVIDGAGLVINRAQLLGGNRKRIRITVRSDLMTRPDARTLTAKLLASRGAEDP